VLVELKSELVDLGLQLVLWEGRKLKDQLKMHRDP